MTASTTKYAIAEGSTAEELSEDVATWLELGYEPQGGVSVAAVFARWESRDGWEDETTYTYAQAMCLRPSGEGNV